MLHFFIFKKFSHKHFVRGSHVSGMAQIFGGSSDCHTMLLFTLREQRSHGCEGCYKDATISCNGDI